MTARYCRGQGQPDVNMGCALHPYWRGTSLPLGRDAGQSYPDIEQAVVADGERSEDPIQ